MQRQTHSDGDRPESPKSDKQQAGANQPLATFALPVALAAMQQQQQQATSQPQPDAPLLAAPTAERRRAKPGILRLDINKPRRSSGGSVEFRVQPQLLGEDIVSPSGVVSPHQLSVTWASSCDSKEPDIQYKPMQNNADAEAAVLSDPQKRSATQEEKSYELPSNLTSPAADAFDPIHQEHEDDEHYNDEDDEEDYSVSVSAIMQRRASVRGYRGKRGSRNSRRTSSPMDHVMDNAERRRSSVYTTSSDEGTNQESTQEQIFENIRLHKEVIQSVKLQPWPIRKKLKLVRQAKMYVARHEGALQERFAMSRSTRDLWARFKMLMAARWRHWKRETASFLTVLIPWELRIKEIESHFGSGVASYFTFLRWLMWVNIMIAIPLVAFVIGPEYFATKHDEADPRKRMSEQEFQVAGNLFTIWEFEGYLKYSPMFYGYYSSYSGASSLGYKLPMAYFLTAVVVYIYSFVATLRKMAENSRNSKLSSKDDECTFSWKLFTGWDFMIGHAETAHNRIASVVVGFKEALLEEAEKKKDNRNWRIILQRILVNILVMGLLAASGYTVVALVNNTEKLSRTDNWLSRNAVNVTMTLLSFFLPMIFEALGLFENWHPRQQLRLQLARIMILNLLNLYSLMFSFIYKINSKEKPLQELKIKNETATLEFAQLTSLIESIKAVTVDATTAAASTFSYDWSSTGAFADDSSISTDIYGSSTTEALYTATAAAVFGTAKRLKCFNVTLKCSKPTRVRNPNLAATTLLLLTTAAMLPLNTDPTEPSSTVAWTTLQPTTTTTEIATTTTAEEATTTMLPTSTMIEFTTPPSTSGHEETSTSEEATTTVPQTTSTSTPSPGNDSFFEYYDYFAGMPIDLDDTQLQRPGNSVKAAALSPLHGNSHLRSLNRRARQVATADEASTTTPANSKYSRRRSNDETGDTTSRNQQSLSYDDDYNDSSSTTSSATTITTTATTTLDNTSVPPSPSDEMDSERNQSAFWVPNEQLQNIFAYFISSTSTTADPIESTTSTSTPIPTTPDTTTMSDTTTEETTESDQTSEYYIEEANIVDSSDYYTLKANDVETEGMELCIRTLCEEIPEDMPDVDATPKPASTLTPLQHYQKRLGEVKHTLNTVQSNLTNMCWETSLGQELSKVIVFDGIMSIAAPLCIDFLRALFVRYVNQNWCWDMEKTFPQYGDFKIAENILTLINNQGQVWMGIFFSPGLVLINLAKLMIMMYFRSWIVLTCNVPHEVVFKASKSNNFYLSLLLTMLFLCVLPVSYAIVWLRPSWHCGPFSDYNRISEFITNTTRNALPIQLHEPLDYLTSSSTVIPLLLLLILIIYYLISLTGALREANQDLRTQLQKEREEERKKIFKVPETKPTEPAATNISNRWRKVLEASSPVTPTTQPPDFDAEEYKNQARKELISRIMKKALRKGSATSEDDSAMRHGRDDDDTDNEHHDSLPHDEEAKEKRSALSRLQQIRRTRKPSLVDIVQIAKGEREREAQRPAVAGKEAHPKGRFKVDRHERKEAEPKSPSVDKDNDNDPEINSRIVNERRQSLLYRKREDEAPEESKSIEKQDSGEHQDKKPSSVRAMEPLATPATNKSIFEVINEKRAHEQPHQDGGKFKLKKHKAKTTTSTGEPQVFKFDEKSVEQTGEHLGTQASKHSEAGATPTPSPTPSVLRQGNSEKLVNLSRQGRKKIGSLLALVREAVNTKKMEGEPQLQTESTVAAAVAPAASDRQKQTAIEMPSTPEAAVPVLATPIFEPISKAVTATPTPKLAPVVDTEELDQPGPINFPMRSASQRRQNVERPKPTRQDSQASIWSDNIPTITISTTGSEECILEPASPGLGAATVAAAETGIGVGGATTPPPGSVVNIIKINIEDEK